jgi:hypothetical protein
VTEPIAHELLGKAHTLGKATISTAAVQHSESDMTQWMEGSGLAWHICIDHFHLGIACIVGSVTLHCEKWGGGGEGGGGGEVGGGGGEAEHVLIASKAAIYVSPVPLNPIGSDKSSVHGSSMLHSRDDWRTIQQAADGQGPWVIPKQFSPSRAATPCDAYSESSWGSDVHISDVQSVPSAVQSEPAVLQPSSPSRAATPCDAYSESSRGTSGESSGSFLDEDLEGEALPRSALRVTLSDSALQNRITDSRHLEVALIHLADLRGGGHGLAPRAPPSEEKQVPPLQALPTPSVNPPKLRKRVRSKAAKRVIDSSDDEEERRKAARRASPSGEKQVPIPPTSSVNPRVRSIA